MNDQIDVRRGFTSASNAAFDAACPGRHRAQAGLPEVTSDDAERGTKVHAALAKGTPEGLTLEEAELFDVCQQLEAIKASEFFGTDLPKAKVFREQRYWVRYKDNNAEIEHSGQADVVYRYGPRAMVLDYKTGREEVAESPSNAQLRDLAVLVTGHFVLINDVACVIIQPSVTRTPEVCLYRRADIERAATELFARIVASNDPKSRRIPGQIQCRYCRAKSLCQEYSQWSGSLLPAVVEPLQQEALFKTQMVNWTPAQWSIAADMLGPAELFLVDLKAMLKGRLEKDPASVPGWTLAPGSKRETITNPQAVWDRFAKLGGTIEQYMACLSVGKTLLKEALNTVTGAKGKALDAALKTLTDGYVEVKQTAPSLKKVEGAK